MIEIHIKDKQKYLKENYPFDENISLNDLKECLHCGSTITVGDYKVFKDEIGFEYICCPNAPKCNGTVIDWLPIENKK